MVDEAASSVSTGRRARFLRLGRFLRLEKMTPTTELSRLCAVGGVADITLVMTHLLTYLLCTRRTGSRGTTPSVFSVHARQREHTSTRFRSPRYSHWDA